MGKRKTPAKSTLSRYRYRARARPLWRKKVKRVVQSMAEVKWRDNIFNTSMSTPNTTDSQNGFLLQGPSQAFVCSLTNGILQSSIANANTRVGNKIFIKGYWFSISLNPDSSENNIDPMSTNRSSNLTCRIMIVRNKLGASSLPTAGELVMQPYDSGFRNSLYYGKYDVLYDKLHVMVPTTTSAATEGVYMAHGPAFKTCFYLPIGKSFFFDSSTDSGNAAFYGSQQIGPVGVGDVGGSAVWLNSTNALKEDYQLIAFSGGDSANCCRIQLGWKCLFTDF